jgi:hypothetical protein
MRLRWVGWTRFRTRWAAVLCSTVTVFAALAVSACTGSGTPGGTAGLQHVMLFGLGALALLAGLGSLIYRRRSLHR